MISDVTNFDIMAEDRRLQQDEKVCMRAESLVTPLDVDVTAYGTMFTIQSKDEPIDVLALEFFANPTAKTLRIEIYTKLGDYRGFENDQSAWEKVTNTAVAAPPSEHHPLFIPMSEFQRFTMQPNELRSMFITMRSSDLRYKYGRGLRQGDTYHSDGYLSINVGIGQAGYGFGKKIFPERLFSGIFHYAHHADCDRPRSKAVVQFTYFTRPKDESMQRYEMITELDNRVKKSVSDILNNDLAELKEKNAIILESVETSSSVEDDKQERCPVDKWSACIKLDTKVTLSHLNSIHSGAVRYSFLEKYERVTENAQLGSLEVSYGGLMPVKAEILLAIKGVPNGAAGDSEISRIEDVTTTYLEEEAVGLSNALVIGSKVTTQRGSGFSKERLAVGSGRKLKGAENLSARNDWIELTMDVMGVYRPPYSSDVDFDYVVKKAFNNDEVGYIYKLKREPIQADPNNAVKGINYFLGVNEILARLPNTAKGGGNPETDKKVMGFSKFYFIGGCSGLLFVGILSYLYVLRRTTKKRKNSSNGSVGGPQIMVMLNDGKSNRTFATSASSLNSNGHFSINPSQLSQVMSQGAMAQQAGQKIPLIQNQQSRRNFQGSVVSGQRPGLERGTGNSIRSGRTHISDARSVGSSRSHNSDGRSVGSRHNRNSKGKSSHKSSGDSVGSSHSRSSSRSRSSPGRSNHNRSDKSTHSRSDRSTHSRSDRSTHSRSDRSTHSRSDRSTHSRSDRSTHSRSDRSTHSRSDRSTSSGRSRSSPGRSTHSRSDRSTHSRSSSSRSNEKDNKSSHSRSSSSGRDRSSSESGKRSKRERKMEGDGLMRESSKHSKKSQDKKGEKDEKPGFWGDGVMS